MKESKDERTGVLSLRSRAARAVDGEWVYSMHWGKTQDWAEDALYACVKEISEARSRVRELEVVIRLLQVERKALDEEFRYQQELTKREALR